MMADSSPRCLAADLKVSDMSLHSHHMQARGPDCFHCKRKHVTVFVLVWPLMIVTDRRKSQTVRWMSSKSQINWFSSSTRHQSSFVFFRSKGDFGLLFIHVVKKKPPTPAWWKLFSFLWTLFHKRVHGKAQMRSSRKKAGSRRRGAARPFKPAACGCSPWISITGKVSVVAPRALTQSSVGFLPHSTCSGARL